MVSTFNFCPCLLYYVAAILCLILSFLFFCSIKKHDSYEAPIKSKEPLIFNVGFRQFTAR